MTGAVVVGGDYRGLGVVRSLGRRGVPVRVMADRGSLAATSRYTSERTRWPSRSEDDQVACLLTMAVDHGLDGWVLFPTAEETAALIARHHGELGARYRLTTSPWLAHEAAADKRLAYARAAALGIEHPRTYYPSGPEDLALDLAYPVILKPTRRAERPSPFTDAKAWQVRTPPELLQRYRDACAQVGAEHVMVQELLTGGGDARLSLAGVARDGDLVASIVARRARQYPTDFGRASTFVETVDDAEVAAAGALLVKDLGLSGPVEVEFHRDPRDGVLRLLDVNPRVWGWHSLGAHAGVDVPYLAWLLATGQEVGRCEARPGVRWVRLSTDVSTYTRELLARRTTLGSYLWSLRPPIAGPIAARDDPLPIAAELWLVAVALVDALLGRGGSGGL